MIYGREIQYFDTFHISYFYYLACKNIHTIIKLRNNMTYRIIYGIWMVRRVNMFLLYRFMILLTRK